MWLMDGVMIEHQLLHNLIHLMRFQYDPITDSSVKFNDKCEFPEILDLSNYINSKEGEEVQPEDSKYVLHAVLVHR